MRHDGDDDYGLPHVEVVVPDDARELAEDLAAWRREERRRVQRDRLARFLKPFTKHGLAAPLIAAALVVALVSGGLMTFFGPKIAGPQPTMSALGDVTATPGSVGGLLPDLELAWGGRRHAVRDMRPALIIVVPSGCDCSTALVDLANQAFSKAVTVYLMPDRRTSGVAVKDAHKELVKLARPIGKEDKGIPVLVDDPNETPLSPFAEQVGSSGLSALLVNAGGGIVDIRIELRRIPDLEVGRAQNI